MVEDLEDLRLLSLGEARLLDRPTDLVPRVAQRAPGGRPDGHDCTAPWAHPPHASAALFGQRGHPSVSIPRRRGQSLRIRAGGRLEPSRRSWLLHRVRLASALRGLLRRDGPLHCGVPRATALHRRPATQPARPPPPGGSRGLRYRAAARARQGKRKRDQTISSFSCQCVFLSHCIDVLTNAQHKQGHMLSRGPIGSGNGRWNYLSQTLGVARSGFPKAIGS